VPTNTPTPTNTAVPAPLAVGDSGLQALGNVAISLAAPGVLGNDTLNGATLTALNATSGTLPLTSTSQKGGNVVLRADGGFDFNPAAGFQGTDSFTYTLTNSAGSSTATVSINVSGMIWFVDNSLGANGDGRLTTPFNCLTGSGCFSAAPSQVGDTIFLFSQSPATYTGGLTLLGNQKLIGQGAKSSLSALSGLTLPPNSILLPQTGGTNPAIVTIAANSDAIKLATNNTIDGLSVGNKTGVGISGSNFGTLTVADSSISGTGQALNLVNGTVSGTFATVSSTSGASNIALQNLTGSLVMSQGTLSGATGTAFSVDGGNALIAYGGSITTSSASPMVQVQNRTGGSVTFSGTLSSNTAGLVVRSNTGGSTIFSGTSKTISSGATPAINLLNNVGHGVDFTNGGLKLTTTSATTFTATGGGTVSVSGSGNSLSAASASALNFADTIGTSGLNFVSISSGTASSGPVNGIVLTNTGSSGGLNVSGSGSLGSGGTIQHTSGVGVLLTNTSNVNLTSMVISSTTGNGIGGTQVANFSFVNGSIDQSSQGSNIGFDSSQLGTEDNVSGAVTVTGNALSNASVNGVLLRNFSGTLTSVNISNNTITSPTSASSSTGSGIQVIAFGSATTAASVSQATISNNSISNFPGGGGISVQGGNSNTTGPGGSVGVPNSSTNVISISGNHIAGQSSTAPMGTEAILASTQGGNGSSRSHGNFSITNNGTANNPIANITGAGISNSTFGFSTVTSTISGNVLAPLNKFGSVGIGGGVGSVANNFSDTPDMTATITSNTISQTDGNGILFVARSTSGSLKAKIQNNTVAAALSGDYGIRVDSGNSVGGSATVCLNLANNTSSALSPFTGIGLRKQGTNPAINVFGISGITPTPPTNADVVNFENAQNAAGGGTQVINGSGFVSCSLP
jgi:hypothetical protein